MAASTALFELLVIALLIYLPLCRFATFRKLMGYEDMFSREAWWKKSTEELYVDRISRAGSGPARRAGDVLVCEANLGVRLLVPAMLAFLFFHLMKDGVSSLLDMATSFALFGLACWWAYSLWTFRLEISGHEIATRDWLLRDRIYDLATLVRAEKDKGGSYRLEFADGSACHVIRYITGHDAFRETVLTALTVNARFASREADGDLEFGARLPHL